LLRLWVRHGFFAHLLRLFTKLHVMIPSHAPSQSSTKVAFYERILLYLCHGQKHIVASYITSVPKMPNTSSWQIVPSSLPKDILQPPPLFPLHKHAGLDELSLDASVGKLEAALCARDVRSFARDEVAQSDMEGQLDFLKVVLCWCSWMPLGASWSPPSGVVDEVEDGEAEC
jgi:hypothetical protein